MTLIFGVDRRAVFQQQPDDVRVSSVSGPMQAGLSVFQCKLCVNLHALL
jgi:hypothetical protein